MGNLTNSAFLANFLKASLAFLVLGVSACGPYGGSHLGSNPSGLPASERTGFEKKSRDPKTGLTVTQDYTVAGNLDLYQELRAAVEGHAPGLAQAILDVDLQVQRSQDHPTTVAVKVKVDPIYFDLREIHFQTPLEQRNGRFTATTTNLKVVPSQFPSTFQLSVECADAGCGRVKLLITEVRNSIHVKVGILFVESKNDLRTQRSRVAQARSPIIQRIVSSLRSPIAMKSSIVVVNGPSYSRVKILANGKTSVIEIQTELLNTELSDVAVQSLQILGSTSQTLSARLVGNDPTRGGLIIDIDDDASGDGLRFILAQDDAPGGEAVEVTLDPNIGVLIPPKDLPETSDVHAFTQQLNQYATDVQVTERIRLWQGDTTAKACSTCRPLHRGRAQPFLYNTKLVENVISKNLLKADVSPEAAYILAIESEFLRIDSHPIQIASTTSASGPWQLVNGTAKELVSAFRLPYTITEAPQRGRNKQLDPKDARGRLSSSTHIAGFYLRRLRRHYPHDAGLAFLSYYRGEGAVGGFVRNTCGQVSDGTVMQTSSFGRRYCKYAVTLNQIHRFNMAKKEHTDYAYSVIALRFIGLNPRAYGFTLPGAGTKIPTALREKL